ncbi:MAG: TonB-dependent receptor [Bacteroidota bacterium]
MKHRHIRFSFSHVLLLISVTLAIPGVGSAGNGKVTGRVIDRETQDPVPGANVVLTHVIATDRKEIPLDRPLGASTDMDGYYFILNVPPGVYVVRASAVGFHAVSQRTPPVEPDRTIIVNFQTTVATLPMEQVEVIAERPIIRQDVAATQEIIETERIEAMPVLRLDEFVGRIKGITLVTGAEGNGLSVRGGAIRETDIRLDGMSLQDPRTDNSYLALNSTTVQEMQVLTGGFEAKYGGIRSGLLNVVTREGQRDRYTLSLKADFAPANQPHFFGANPWSDDSWVYKVFAGQYAMRGIRTHQDSISVPSDFWSFKGWIANQGADRALDSLQRRELWLRQHPKYSFGSKPDYFLEGSITGPFPGESLPIIGAFAERTTFLLGARYENSQMAYPLGSRDNYVDWNTQLKLTSTLSDNMRLSINGMYAKIKTLSGGRATQYGGALIDQSSSFSFLNNSESSVSQQARLLGGDSWIQMFNLSRVQFCDQRYMVAGARFTHTLSSSAFYTVDFQLGYTDQTLTPFAADTSNPDVWATYTSARTRLIYRFLLPQYGSPNASTNYGYDPLNFFTIYGGPQRIDSSYSWVYQLKGDLTTQLGRHHQIEAGFSARLQDLFVYTGTWFQSELSYTPDTWLYYRARPLEIGLYVQDKLEFEGMVLNVGLRADYFNPMKGGYRTNFPLPDYQSLYADVYQNLGGTSGRYDRWVLFRSLLGNPPGWPTDDARVQAYLSPRLGVSFPITETSKLYFNYGHFYQRPPTAFLYDLKTNLGSTALPTPDLTMAKTISYEFGYEQMLFSEILANVTAYYKDVRGEPLSRKFIDYYEADITYKYFPDKYRDIRGVELRLERPFGRFWTLSAFYDYMVSSDGQSGLSQVFENRLLAMDNEVRSANLTVTEPHPRANITLNLHTPEDFGPELFGIRWLERIYANFFFEWQDGGRILLNPDQTDIKLWRYADVVDRWNIDFRGSKTFATSAGSFELVVTIKNLTNNKWLNTANMTQTQYSNYKASLMTPDKGGSDKWGQYGGKIDTGWWEAPVFLNPRRVIVGFRYNI